MVYAYSSRIPRLPLIQSTSGHPLTSTLPNPNPNPNNNNNNNHYYNLKEKEKEKEKTLFAHQELSLSSCSLIAGGSAKVPRVFLSSRLFDHVRILYSQTVICVSLCECFTGSRHLREDVQQPCQ